MSPIDRLMSRLHAVFGEPRTPDPDTFLHEFARAIGGWSDDVLAKAGDEIIRTCTFWPKPAEVNEAAQRIVSATYKPTPYPAGPELPPPTPEEAERARKLVEEAAQVIIKRGKEAMGIEDKPMRDVSRPAFESMQRNSPNEGLHRRKLSDRSRQMMGDRDDHTD